MSERQEPELPPEYILVPEGTIHEWDLPQEMIEARKRPLRPEAQAAIDAEHRQIATEYLERERKRRRSRGE